MAYNPRTLMGSKVGATGGAAAYGSVPGQTAMPDPAADLGKVYPNLSESNTAISQNILNELNAEISPGTIANIKDNAASFGVSSGMPGSDFSGYRGLRNLGLESRDIQQSGLNNYLAATQGISNTQTVRPETQIGLNQSNAALAAAPDPTAAAAERERLFNLYLDQMNRASSGGGSAPQQSQNRMSGWNRFGGAYDYDMEKSSDRLKYFDMLGNSFGRMV